MKISPSAFLTLSSSNLLLFTQLDRFGGDSWPNHFVELKAEIWFQVLLKYICVLKIIEDETADSNSFASFSHAVPCYQ